MVHGVRSEKKRKAGLSRHKQKRSDEPTHTNDEGSATEVKTTKNQTCSYVHRVAHQSVFILHSPQQELKPTSRITPYIALSWPPRA
jgi:hypothetical protein